MNDDRTEELARALHARRCRFYGFSNQFQIDMYWDGCDQAAYRRKASERLAIPAPSREDTDHDE